MFEMRLMSLDEEGEGAATTDGRRSPRHLDGGPRPLHRGRVRDAHDRGIPHRDSDDVLIPEDERLAVVRIAERILRAESDEVDQAIALEHEEKRTIDDVPRDGAVEHPRSRRFHACALLIHLQDVLLDHGPEDATRFARHPHPVEEVDARRVTQIDHREEAADVGPHLDVGTFLEGPHPGSRGGEETDPFELRPLVRHEPDDVRARGTDPNRVECAGTRVAVGVVASA